MALPGRKERQMAWNQDMGEVVRAPRRVAVPQPARKFDAPIKAPIFTPAKEPVPVKQGVSR